MSSLFKVFLIKDLSSRLILGNRRKLPNMSRDIKSSWIAGFLEVDFCKTSLYPGYTKKMHPNFWKKPKSLLKLVTLPSSPA